MFRNDIITFCEHKAKINNTALVTFNLIKQARLFKEDWLEEAEYTSSIVSLLRIDPEAEYVDFSIRPNELIINFRTYLGRNEYDFDGICIPYEKFDNIEAWIKEEKSKQLANLSKHNKQKRISQKDEVNIQEQAERIQYEKLKAKFGDA